MEKAVIVIIALLLIIGGTLAYLYFYYEKPNQALASKPLEYVNFSIYSQENGNYVSTGYEIEVDGQKLKDGKTMSQSPILESLPVNHSVVIYNKNIGNQTYYTDYFKGEYFGSGFQNQRVELNLERPCVPAIEQNDEFGSLSNKVTLIIYCDNVLKNINLCFRWSTHIINVNSDSAYFPSNIPKMLENWDKCLNINQSISNNSIIIPISYSTFGKIDINDFIDVAIVDSECQNGICSVEDENGDIAGKTFVYSIKKNINNIYIN